MMQVQTLECYNPGCTTATYVEEHDVFACFRCGRVGGLEDAYECHDGTRLFNGGRTDDFVRVVGETALDDVAAGPLAIIKSPFKAKGDIKKLPFRQTGRQWSDEIGHWVILSGCREMFVDHMRDCGWDVVDLVSLRHESMQHQ